MTLRMYTGFPSNSSSIRDEQSKFLAKHAPNECYQIINSQHQRKESSTNPTLYVEDAGESVDPLMELSKTPSHNLQEDHLGSVDLAAKVTRLEAKLLARNAEVHELRIVNENLKENCKILCFDTIKNHDDIRFFTGLPIASVFVRVTELVNEKTSSCHSSLTSNGHVLIVFKRFCLN